MPNICLSCRHRVRGLCKNTLIVKRFTFKQLPLNPGNMIILGQSRGRIEYNDTSNLWILTDAKYEVTASSTAPKQSYLLGIHEWTISNDNCEKGKPYTAIVKLTGCNP